MLIFSFRPFYISVKLAYEQDRTRIGETSPKENEYTVRLFRELFLYVLILT